ncbi:MAG TPA: sensor histidine kinase [Rhizomicrobium sp.]|nr:sensor histidine kinase [Rhizomicrobium sp.]
MLRSSGWSLRLRLLLSVGLVLLPPALLSIMQGVASAQRDIADLRGALISTTRAAATPAENALASAREVTLALSHLPDIRDATAACTKDLSSAIRGLAFVSNIARLDRTGRVVCAALPQSIGMSAADAPYWHTIAHQHDFVVAGMTMSPLTHRNVIVGLLPLHDEAGHFQGSLNIAIEADWLNSVLNASPLPSGSVMAIFDGNRNLVASTNAGVAQTIFARHAPRNGTPTLRTAMDKNGMSWTYATAALSSPNVYVAFAMPDTKLFGEAYMHAAVDILLPFAMILLTWAAIWVVTDRQLTRWIIYLKRISAVYRSGHYALRPSLGGAPSEVRMLGDAMADMAQSIDERDRSLRDAIEQKSLLIKEIHHRVKNNLQVVMSLLNLQAKRLKDRGAQEALRDTTTRINALALVHRMLYEIDNQNTVDVKRLLEQLAEQTNEGFGGDSRHVRVIADVIERAVPSDLAVTLSLFAVEAVTNAFKHAFPNRGGTIRIVLEPANGHDLRLAVEDDGIGYDGDAESQSSIGARLIKTFGQQMGGETKVHSDPGKGSIVEIVFPDPALKCREGSPFQI